MNKSKIVHIITRLDTGGSAENTIITCSLSDKSRFETTLVYGPPLIKTLSCESVVLPSLVREISPVKDIITLIALFRLLRKIKPDVVHTHSSKGGVIGRWAAWLYNQTTRVQGPGSRMTKIVHTPHGHVFYGYEFGLVKTLVFRLVEIFSAFITTKLIALTQGEMKESLSAGVGKPGQWTVIHSGVDIDPAALKPGASVRKQLGLPENALVAGTIARLEHVKGVKFLIEAAGLLSKRGMRDVYWLVVGGGKLMDVLASRANALGLKDRIVFAGMRDDVTEMFSSMDIYVQPSLNEGMGKTIVQACALGLPVIASRVQGIPDIIKDEETGMLVPPANPEALAEKIQELINDPAKRKKLGESGRIFVNRISDGFPFFSSKRMVHLMEKLYENLLR
ncbi:MAG: glycosyltransferase family 4 protein [Elusimicrobiota bacterium]